MENTQPTAPKPFRRWYQYSLRTLMIVVTLFALLCSWFAVKLGQARRQREAVEALIKSGCIVHYDYESGLGGFWKPNTPPPRPAWLYYLLGIDFFCNVTEITSRAKKVLVVLNWNTCKE
jgi:hypothetical protein